MYGEVLDVAMYVLLVRTIHSIVKIKQAIGKHKFVPNKPV